MSELIIDNLHGGVGEAEILHGITLRIAPGEVHAIMGPNGAGKSTLSAVLMGRPGYRATSGSVTLGGDDMLALDTWERAAHGLHLVMQYPSEVPGVSIQALMTEALKRRGRDATDIDALLAAEAQRIGFAPEFLTRSLNVDMSGGEKKRNEILQMSLLEPSLALLDETDSGLDIDALKVVSDGVNALRSEDRAILMVTHYQRLLNHIVPDYVHVLAGGKIIKSGDRELALELEEKGYGWLGIKDDDTSN